LQTFKIVFYKSHQGNLLKVKEFYRQAEELQELIADPPDEFFEMLNTFMPVHGWAEIEGENNTVYVIFAPRDTRLEDVEESEFQDWLDHVRPGDFKDFGNE